jgi:lysophospholipase L1-like esterase
MRFAQSDPMHVSKHRLVFLVVSTLISCWLLTLIIPSLQLLWEKHTLPKPKGVPYKSEVQGVSISSDSGRVKYPDDLTIVMVGDSMTEVLGNSDELRSYLAEYYPKKSVEVLNYGYGSTNILSAYERITQETNHGRIFRPVTNIDYDLLILESFGHNPLSEFPLEEGLKRQNQALDQIITTLQQAHPNAKLVFLATIAPNTRNYAKNQVELSGEGRRKWADERKAYIENHIKYAQSHQIPVIDVYHKSMDAQGDGKLIYISDRDYIHPSPLGVLLISKEIADFIHNNNLMPN